MNVLIPHISFETFGGAESVVQQIANRLVGNGDSVTITTYKATDEAREKIKGCKFVQGDYQDLKAWVHQNIDEFDVVNSHNHPMELLVWPKKANKHIWNFNEPPIYVMAGMPINPVEKMIVEDSVDLAVVANHTNNELFKSLYRLPTFTNLYGIDVDFYSSGNPENVIDKYNLKDSFVVSTVAWFNPYKRPQASVETLASLVDYIPNIKLVLAGKSEGTMELQVVNDIINKYNLSKYVVITGHIPKEEARDLYFASNVILCPFAMQGGYLTVMEAICARKPVVASTESMLAYDLNENKAGIVTNDYTGAILDFYRDGKLGYDLETAYKWVSQFTWDRYLDNMMILFKGTN